MLKTKFQEDGRMTGNNKVLIYNARIVTEQDVIDSGAIVFQGEHIEFVGPSGDIPEEHLQTLGREEKIDAEGSWVLPGFIDVHMHGGYGHDFMDANKSSLDAITRFHGMNGTTCMLATSVTAPKEDISRMVAAANNYINEGMSYAQLLGVHLEGPFISPRWPGAQNPAYIVPPRLEWMEEWVERYPGVIKMLTLAPETEGALEMIEWCTERGIVAACGHTDASYGQLEQAVGRGLRHAVHTFNAMKPLHHREPGTVGAVLSDSRISAEIIADGHHVHPACISLLTKVKTEENLILITDATAPAGMGDGEYDLGGLQVVVRDGIARVKEGGSLAGSTLTMIDAFSYVVRNIGLSVPEASRLASSNPAKLLGIENTTGALRAGLQADILLVDDKLELTKVWVRGQLLGR
jgi:N-acetylglucosamine-6-phosphate deacetylase